MNLATLDITPEQAREGLAEYEQMIASERTAEDLAIAAGYRAAARNLPVISLASAVKTAGLHDNTLPRIAVCRADAAECYVRWDWSNDALVFADADSTLRNYGALVGKHTVRVPGIARPPAQVGKSQRHSGTCMVPIIPPRYRPRRARLHRFHILWEVEQWSTQPPRDPALLRHIRGDLWSVLAVWDLTDLERAVLAQRAR